MSFLNISFQYYYWSFENTVEIKNNNHSQKELQFYSKTIEWGV